MAKLTLLWRKKSCEMSYHNSTLPTDQHADCDFTWMQLRHLPIILHKAVYYVLVVC